MMIPEHIAGWLAFNFEIMMGDSISLDYFSSGRISDHPANTVKRRMLVTDCLYRCIKSGLIIFSDFDDLKSVGFSSVEDYCAALVNAPQDSEGTEVTDEMLLWIVPEIETTAAGKALYSAVFSRPDVTTPFFGATIESINEFSRRISAVFAENGLPWTGDYRFPVVVAQ